MSKTKPAKGKVKRQYIDQRLAAAIGHPIRVEVLIEAVRAPISPIEFTRRYGHSLTTVAYHFRRLRELDCLIVVDEVQRRGAHERIHALTRYPLLTDDDFALMPAIIRAGFTESIFSAFAGRVEDALAAQTIERQPNHHLTWTPLRLDKLGFDRVMEKLGDVLEFLSAEQLAACERMKESGGETLYATVGLFGFESPPADRDHDLTNDPDVQWPPPKGTK